MAKMVNPRQPRNPIFTLTFGAATAALLIALMLTVIASQPAQAQTFTVLHTFTGGQDGKYPYAGVTLDKAGRNLYGTTHNGGNGLLSPGTIYKLQHNGSDWTFSSLYSFTGFGYDGEIPQGRVTFGPNGSLYGTANLVFSLGPQLTICFHSPCPWMETVIYAFSGQTDGSAPSGDLIFDHAGNIYGTTQSGGLYTGPCSGPGCGTVYQLTHAGGVWTENIIHNFTGSDGFVPNSGVIFDTAGNLYGTAVQGGSSGYGTVFELSPSGGGWTEKVLYNFQSAGDGSYPRAGLVIDQSGNLYGATSNGGAGGGGTVYELSPSGDEWSLTTLYSFSGSGPWASLTMDASGNIYGTTYGDGAHGLGSIFKLIPAPAPPWTYTSLHDFTGGNDGEQPISNVIMDASGNLYGTASNGGAQGVGVVWQITFP